MRASILDLRRNMRKILWALDKNESNVMRSIQKDYKTAYDLITGKLREANDKWNGLDDTILAKFNRREKLFKELNDILNDLFRKVNRKIKRFTQFQFTQVGIIETDVISLSLHVLVIIQTVDKSFDHIPYVDIIPLEMCLEKYHKTVRDSAVGKIINQ